MIGLVSVNKTVGCFDRSIKNSYSVRLCIIAEHSPIRVESRNSACVNRREFADIRFILFIPLWDCSNAAPMEKNLKHRTLHKMVDCDLGLCLKFVR